MLITPAYAQAATDSGDGFMQTIGTLFPLIAVFIIFYFIVLRPQQQRMKALATMVANVRRGDTVVTNGGLVGKVTKVVDDNEVQVEIAEGVRVKVIRSAIADVRTKGEPASGDGKKSDE